MDRKALTILKKKFSDAQIEHLREEWSKNAAEYGVKPEQFGAYVSDPYGTKKVMFKLHEVDMYGLAYKMVKGLVTHKGKRGVEVADFQANWVSGLKEVTEITF